MSRRAMLASCCRLSVILAALALALPSQGDEADAGREAELARQRAFETGFAEIVEDLRRGSFERLAGAIDNDAFLERIFGLRLIDPKVKRDFEQDFDDRLSSLLTWGFPKSEDGVPATLLAVESRGDRGRAVVRFDLDEFQFGYHEYELRLDDKNRVAVVDWVDFLRGDRFTDRVGMMLIMASPREPAVRKLVDYTAVRQSELFQLIELLKAARDRQVDRYMQILGSLGDDLKRQRATVLTTVHLAQETRNRRMLRTALVELAEHFPDEPEYSLMLLDYYFPTRRYELALEALQRLDARLAVEDAAMDARLSAAKLVLGRVDAAIADAERATTREPSLELGWWSLLRALALAEEYGRAVDALEKLESDFGYALDRETLAKDPAFAGLLSSEAYAARRGGAG